MTRNGIVAVVALATGFLSSGGGGSVSASGHDRLADPAEVRVAVVGDTAASGAEVLAILDRLRRTDARPTQP